MERKYYRCISFETKNKSLHFNQIWVMGIEQLTKDILKTLELYSDQNGFNNAAALLADNNHFKGIDIIRFGDSIDEIMERKSVDKIPEKAFR